MDPTKEKADLDRRFARWPPTVVNIDNLGYLEDSCGKYYPRDIGRSSVLGPKVIMQFGDTFVHGQNQNFICLTSCTAAVVHNPAQPTISTYSNTKIDGVIQSFIPLLPGEVGNGVRTTLWTFGGIIQANEPQGNLVTGWTFFQKGIMEGGQLPVLSYTGASKVFCNMEKNTVSALRDAGTVPLFTREEPSYGTFTAISLEGYAYLFGHAPNSTDVMLARVPINFVCSRSHYTYWDGIKYQDQPLNARPVMNGVRHGSIYRSGLFSPGTGRDWVFIGETSLGDSQVKMGVSSRLEGPYEMVTLMDTYPLRQLPGAEYRYCVYAHPWAFDEGIGEIMISWCEGTMDGKVVAVKVKLATDPAKKISIAETKTPGTFAHSFKKGKKEGRCGKKGGCVVL